MSALSLSIPPILPAPGLISGDVNSMAAAALSRHGDEDNARGDSDDRMFDDVAVYRDDFAA